MSYEKAMRWAKKHPRGTRQVIIMSTRSGFWPSISWSENEYRPYVEACNALGCKALDAEEFYKRTLKNGHIQRTPQDYAECTKSEKWWWL